MDTKDMILEQAYKIVLNDIKQTGSGLFKGIYDAKNSKDNFMDGILFVMEFISYKAKDNDFMDAFFINMIKSEGKAND